MNTIRFKLNASFETIRVALTQKDAFYKVYGTGEVRNYTRRDFFVRLFSHVCDSISMLIPAMIWLIYILLLLAGVFHFSSFHSMQTIIKVLIVVSLFVTNSLWIYKLDNQTLGKRYYGLKIVKEDGSELTWKQQVLREVLGKSVPILLSLLLFGNIGVILCMIITYAFILIDKQGRNWIDIILKNKILVVKEIDELDT